MAKIDDQVHDSDYLGSCLFRAGESVFLALPGLLSDAPDVRFGDSEWSIEGVVDSRRSLRSFAARVSFPESEPWRLIARELAMIMLNPMDERLLARGVFFAAAPAKFGLVRSRVASLKQVEKWQSSKGISSHMSDWEPADWEGLISGLISQGNRRGTIANVVTLIKQLVGVRSAITLGAPEADPWPGRSAADVARNAEIGSTPVLGPDTWAPLLKAAWVYISVFSDDIIGLRETHDCRAHRAETTATGKSNRRDEELAFFVQQYGGPVPGRTSLGDLVPNWSKISLLVTAGVSPGIFHNTPRRKLVVEDAMANGLLGGLVSLDEASYESAFRSWIDVRGIPSVTVLRKGHQFYDEKLSTWLESNGRVALKRPSNHLPIEEHDINWAMVERDIFGELGLLGKETNAGRRRRLRIVDYAQSSDHYLAVDGVRSTVRSCVGFAHVEQPDGTVGPWATELSDYDAYIELRCLRAACYIFIASMTLMRDSEIQETQKESIVEYFGQKALRSKYFKGRSSPTTGYWWVTDEVCSAVRVLERLSLDDSYLFGPVVQDVSDAMVPAKEVECFIKRVNATSRRTGLHEIPGVAWIAPRSFRRTSASILGELGADELALSRQLKHSISFTQATVTAGYMAPDRRWSELLHEEEQHRALLAMTNELRSLSESSLGLSGGGADKLRSLVAELEGKPRATVVSNRDVQALLKSAVGELHMGVANACLFDERSALCLKSSTSVIPAGPVFAKCAPTKCRNSAIMPMHSGIWMQERDSLEDLLSRPGLSLVRKRMLESRLNETLAILEDLGIVDG